MNFNRLFVQYYSSLNRKSLSSNSVVLYGYHSILSALSSKKRKKYHQLYFQQYDTTKDLTKINKQRKEIYNILSQWPMNERPTINFANKKELFKLSHNRPHNGYILICDQLSIPYLNYLPKLSKQQQQIYLLLDSIHDPENMGAIIRNASFYNINGILLPNKGSAPISNVVTKTSVGSSEYMNLFYINQNTFLDQYINDDQVDIIGLSLNNPFHKPLINLHDINQKKNIILVIGNESKGISNNILKKCNMLTKINGDINRSSGSYLDSLNVSASTAIALYALKEKKNKFLLL